MARKSGTAAKRGKPAAKPAMYCSFCMKANTEVATLVSGPGRIFICNECVGLCNEVIAGNIPKASRPAKAKTEWLLSRLRPFDETIQARGEDLQRMIDQLRERKVSWAEIGTALAVSRQSAWERFS